MYKYRCIVKCGHAGSGRFTERSVVVSANNVTEAYMKAKRLRGVKKGYLMHSGASVLAVCRLEPHGSTSGLSETA